MALLTVGGILTGAGTVPASMLVGLVLIECGDYNEWKGIHRMDGTMGSINGLASKSVRRSEPERSESCFPQLDTARCGKYAGCGDHNDPTSVRYCSDDSLSSDSIDVERLQTE